MLEATASTGSVDPSSGSANADGSILCRLRWAGNGPPTSLSGLVGSLRPGLRPSASHSGHFRPIVRSWHLVRGSGPTNPHHRPIAAARDCHPFELGVGVVDEDGLQRAPRPLKIPWPANEMSGNRIALKLKQSIFQTLLRSFHFLISGILISLGLLIF